tara:strand:+ start:183 stop:491 length:309 start_codon:yes stop_codon:yes gene_type:complete
MIVLKILGIIFLILLVLISIIAAYVTGMRKGFTQLIRKGIKWGKLETSVFNNLMAQLALLEKNDEINLEELVKYRQRLDDYKKTERRKKFAKKIKNESKGKK